MSIRTVVLLVSVVILGCSRVARPEHQMSIARSPRPLSRELITKTEINTAHAISVYDAIRRLRPQYLYTESNRDVAGAGRMPVVYVNGSLAGDLSVLRQISADLVVEIRYVRPLDAMTPHGDLGRAGEIHVFTYRSRIDPRSQ